MPSPGASPVTSIRFPHLAQVVVTILSATGFSIREKWHDWVQIAIVETMKTSSGIRSMSEEEVRPYAGQRLDVFLATALQRSRTHVQTLLKQGLVHLRPAAAKAQSSYRLRPGDTVTV